MALAMKKWSEHAAACVARGEKLPETLDAIGQWAHELGNTLFPGTPVAGGYGIPRDSGARTTELTHRLFEQALKPTLDFFQRDWYNVVDRSTGAPPSFPATELPERLAARDPTALSLSHLSRIRTALGETVTARVDIAPAEGERGYRVTTVYPSDPARIEAIRDELAQRWEEMGVIPAGDPRAVEAAADFYYDYIRLYWHDHGNDEIGMSLIAGYLEQKDFPVTGLAPETSLSGGAFQNDRETFVRRFSEGAYLRFAEQSQSEDAVFASAPSAKGVQAPLADLSRLDGLLSGFPTLQRAFRRNPRTLQSLLEHPSAAALVLQTLQDMQSLRARQQPLTPPGNARPYSALSLRNYHLSQLLTRKVEARDDLGRQPGFRDEWRNDPVRTGQYLDHLYLQAKDAQPGFAQLVNDLALLTGGEPQLRGEPKDRGRLLDKLSKYGGDASRLTDLLAARIVFKDVNTLYQALDRLNESAQVTLIGFEDRIISPQFSGYRDVTTLLRLPNGHVAEFRLELRALTEYAAQVEHPLYEVIRDVRAQAAEEGRPLSNAESYLVGWLLRHAQNGYRSALLRSVEWARPR